MKKTNSIFLLFLIFFNYSCGFNPALKNINNKTSKIKKIEFSGSENLIFYLKSILDLPVNQKLVDGYIVKIKILGNNDLGNRNSTGIATEEKISVSINLSIYDNNKKLIDENFSDNKTILLSNNLSQDRESKKIEFNNIVYDLLNKVIFVINTEIYSN